MFATGSRAVFVLVFASSCIAADAPAIHQSHPHFSNAIAGPGFNVSWSATPLELSTDEFTTLAIRFDGVVNPDRVRRPDLASLTSFKANFREILTGSDGPPDAASVTFHYRVRPRNESVRAVPELKVAYYSPGSGVSTKYLDEIPLAIKPATGGPAVIRFLEAPERFFALPDPNRAAERPPSWLAWIGLFVVLSIAPSVWIYFWRHRNPDGVRLANLRRIRAVREALDGLDRAGRSPDPVAAAMRVFHGYLASRFGAMAASPTPGDISQAMVEVEMPTARIAEAVQLVRDCDAARFAGKDRGDAMSIARVRGLILAWEEQS